jgi:hypothetical protein
VLQTVLQHAAEALADKTSNTEPIDRANRKRG